MRSNKFRLILAPALSALLSCSGLVRAEEFEDASIFLERNVVDDDAEAVITVSTDEAGLTSLLVIAPDGRRVARFESRNRRSLGIRELLLESPEPDPVSVLAAYPEGTYRIVGRTFDGEELRAEADLSHLFPDPAAITFPAEGAVVPAAGLVIRWQTVPGAAGYILELEHEGEDQELELLVNLPASATSFSPPAGWVLSGAEYNLGIGSVGQNGNRTFVETVFNTAE
jgi:hypothetical protein